MRKLSSFREKLTAIPGIGYEDPFEILNIVTEFPEDEKIVAIYELLSKPLEKLSTRELLMLMYSVDKEIFIKLKNHLNIINENKR